MVIKLLNKIRNIFNKNLILSDRDFDSIIKSIDDEPNDYLKILMDENFINDMIKNEDYLGIKK